MVYTAWITDQAMTLVQQTTIPARGVHNCLADDTHTSNRKGRADAKSIISLNSSGKRWLLLALLHLKLLHWMYEPYPLYVTVPTFDATVRTVETYEQTHQRAEGPYETRPTHKTPHHANLQLPWLHPKVAMDPLFRAEQHGEDHRADPTPPQSQRKPRRDHATTPTMVFSSGDRISQGETED